MTPIANEIWKNRGTGTEFVIIGLVEGRVEYRFLDHPDEDPMSHSLVEFREAFRRIE